MNKLMKNIGIFGLLLLLVMGVAVAGAPSSTWLNDGISWFKDKVGIGTDTPTEMLDVVGNAQVSGIITGATFDSGNGATELYDMNQNVLTTSNVTFNMVSGGHQAIVIVASDGTGQYTNLRTAITANPNAYFYVKEGFYNITDSIKVRYGMNITVQCAGWGTTLYGDNRTGDDGIFYIDDGMLNIYDCHLDGAGQTDITSPHCLNARTSNDGRLNAENNLIENCYFDGVYSKGTPVHLEGNEIKNVGRQGIALVNGNGHTIKNNYVHDVANNLLNIENEAGRYVSNVVISGNYLSGAGIGAGITTGYGGGGRENIIIENNIIENVPQYGIYTYNVTNGAIYRGNKIYNASGVSLIVNEQSNAIITGNTIKNGGAEGIYVKNSPNAVVSNNVLEDTAEDGIFFGSTATGYSTISGNVVIGSGQYGIRSNSEFSTIIGNTIKDVGNSTNLYAGISIDENYISVVGNMIYDSRGVNSGMSYGIESDDGTHYTIIGNTIYGYVNNTMGNIDVAGNNIFSNEDYGNTFQGNTTINGTLETTDSTTIGGDLLVSGSSTTLTATTITGDLLVNGSSTTLPATTVTGNQAGITLSAQGASPDRDQWIQFRMASSNIMKMGIDDTDDAWKLCDGGSLSSSGCHIEVQDVSGDFYLGSLIGTYTNGEAYVCVNDAGKIYASDTACN